MKNNINEQIKEKAKDLFFSYGLKSVSMADIAKQSGISKKIIYEYFDDKNALVSLIINDLIHSHEQLFKTAQSTANDAIDEVLKQDASYSLICKGLRPSFFYELENFFPDAWKELEHYKLKIYKGIMDNLHRGKEERIYRDNIENKVIADLRLHQLLNVLKPELLTGLNLSVKQLADEFTLLYLHSLTTEKGKQLLDKYLNEKRNMS